MDDYQRKLARQYPMPDYMEPDSEGALVRPLIEFLQRWANINRPDLRKIPRIWRLGGCATLVLVAYQQHRGIDADGGCGPQTRKALEESGLDLVAHAHGKDSNDGLTAFMQPNGTILYWAKYMTPQQDRATAEMWFRRSRHGN